MVSTAGRWSARLRSSLRCVREGPEAPRLMESVAECLTAAGKMKRRELRAQGAELG